MEFYDELCYIFEYVEKTVVTNTFVVKHQGKYGVLYKGNLVLEGLRRRPKVLEKDGTLSILHESYVDNSYEIFRTNGAATGLIISGPLYTTDRRPRIPMIGRPEIIVELVRGQKADIINIETGELLNRLQQISNYHTGLNSDIILNDCNNKIIRVLANGEIEQILSNIIYNSHTEAVYILESPMEKVTYITDKNNTIWLKCCDAVIDQKQYWKINYLERVGSNPIQIDTIDLVNGLIKKPLNKRFTAQKQRY